MNNLTRLSIAAAGTALYVLKAVGVAQAIAISPGNWNRFTFGPVGAPSTLLGDYTPPASGSVLTVTDVGNGGDMFSVFDRGSLIGNTSFVPASSRNFICGGDPNVCITNTNISSGSFVLNAVTSSAPAHSISIAAIANPVRIGGAGFFRIDDIPSSPSPSSGVSTFIGSTGTGLGLSNGVATLLVSRPLNVPFIPITGTPLGFLSGTLSIINARPATTASPVPAANIVNSRYSTATRALFNNLSNTYGLISGMADIASALPLSGLAGGVGASLGLTVISAAATIASNQLSLLAQDPPDPDFRLIAQPVIPSLILGTPDGLNVPLATSGNSLVGNLLELIGVAQATITSLNRAQTALDAGEADLANQQLQAAQDYTLQLGLLTQAQPQLLTNLANAYSADGFNRAITVSDVLAFQNAVRTSGLPPLVVQTLTALGADSGLLEQTRQRFLSLDPNTVVATGGSGFSQALVDPSLTATLQATSNALSQGIIVANPSPPQPVPAPSSLLGTLAFGVLGGGSLLKRKLKKQKSAKKETIGE